MYFDYANVLIFLLAGVAFVFINMLIGSLIRPKRPSDEKLTPYECGEDPIGEAWIRFDIRYYTVALVYIVFAVEVAFLFPWARILKMTLTEGFPIPRDVAFMEGIVFMVILFLGLAYVWAKGDLDWVKAIEQERSPLGRQGEAWRELGRKVPLATGPGAIRKVSKVNVPMQSTGKESK